jgi:hypothetical protein
MNLGFSLSVRRQIFTILVFALPLFSSAQLFAGELKIKKVADSIIDSNALHFTEGTWGKCVNGQSFQQDALTSFNGWQYATYYDAERKLCVERRKLNAPNWEVIRWERTRPACCFRRPRRKSRFTK